MKTEQVRRIVIDTIVAAIGTGGLVKQVFFETDPHIELILLFLGFLVAPAPRAMWSLVAMSMGAGSADTTGQSSGSSSSSQPQPSPSSHSGGNNDG